LHHLREAFRFAQFRNKLETRVNVFHCKSLQLVDKRRAASWIHSNRLLENLEKAVN
jgi:hypothetical protein